MSPTTQPCSVGLTRPTASSEPMPGLDPAAQLRLLETLVNIDSPTGGSGVDAVYRVIEPVVRRLGFGVDRLPTEGPIVLRARRTGTAAEPAKVLMLGHVDTVFPEGTAAERPFTVVDGRAHGPGVADMKAGLVVMLAAVAELPPTVAAGLDITMLFTGDEEIGSPDSRPVIEAATRGQDAALVFESARRTGAIVTTRRGVQRYRLDVTGRAAHSGTNPELGSNALETLAHIILTVQGIGRQVDGASVTAVLAQGGSKPNIVPDAASVHVDCRFDDADAEAEVRASLRELSGPGPVDGTHVRLTLYGGRPAFGEPAITLAAACVDAGRDLGLTIATAATGGGSDANLTAAQGIPTIDGLGAVGGNAHAADEYIEVATLPERSTLCAKLLSRLAR